jgi:hypothetical protein
MPVSFNINVLIYVLNYIDMPLFKRILLKDLQSSS